MKDRIQVLVSEVSEAWDAYQDAEVLWEVNPSVRHAQVLTEAKTEYERLCAELAMEVVAAYEKGCRMMCEKDVGSDTSDT